MTDQVVDDKAMTDEVVMADNVVDDLTDSKSIIANLPLGHFHLVASPQKQKTIKTIEF